MSLAVTGKILFVFGLLCIVAGMVLEGIGAGSPTPAYIDGIGTVSALLGLLFWLKDDLRQTRAELRGSVKELREGLEKARAEFGESVDEVRKELREGLEKTRAELKSDFRKIEDNLIKRIERLEDRLLGKS